MVQAQLDCIEVLQDLRAWSSVPVIVLSARDAEGQKVAALDAGANDYVTKPFGVQETIRPHPRPAPATSCR